MPRFFFDFHQSGELFTDTEGTELPGTDQAFLEAFQTAQDMWSELLRKRQDPRRCRFQVRGADGQLLFILPFSEVIESCGRDEGRPDMAGSFRDAAAVNLRGKRVHREFEQEMHSLRNTLEQSRALLLRKV